LGRQLLRSEALASSAIEGLQISHRKLARAEIEGKAGDFKAREVLGNARAMEEAIQIGREARDLTVEDIRSIHRPCWALPHPSALPASGDRAQLCAACFVLLSGFEAAVMSQWGTHAAS
jgi:hypothetical protein